MDTPRQNWLATMRADEQAFFEFLQVSGKLRLDDESRARLDEVRFRPRVGELALRQRTMGVEQIAQVLAAQAGTTQRFGELAVEMGFLKDIDVVGLLENQRQYRPPLSWAIVEAGLMSAEKLWRERVHFEMHEGSAGVVR
ncbi:MAG: hypothetical protein AAF447_12385 [Myxococcota bacterium]